MIGDFERERGDCEGTVGGEGSRRTREIKGAEIKGVGTLLRDLVSVNVVVASMPQQIQFVHC